MLGALGLRVDGDTSSQVAVPMIMAMKYRHLNPVRHPLDWL